MLPREAEAVLLKRGDQHPGGDAVSLDPLLRCYYAGSFVVVMVH